MPQPHYVDRLDTPRGPITLWTPKQMSQESGALYLEWLDLVSRSIKLQVRRNGEEQQPSEAANQARPGPVRESEAPHGET